MNTKDMKTFLCLAGLLIYLLTGFIIAYIVIACKIFPWPFHGSDSVYETYGRIIIYLPVFFYSAASMLWLRAAGIRFDEKIKFYGISRLSAIGIIACSAYSFFYFFTVPFELKGLFFWPPALFLAAMNSMSEEVVFRLTLMSLVESYTGAKKAALIIQAALYSIPHFFIGGLFLGILSFLFGIFLGILVQADKSIIPPIICHFIVDLQAVALPLLIVV